MYKAFGNPNKPKQFSEKNSSLCKAWHFARQPWRVESTARGGGGGADLERERDRIRESVKKSSEK